MSDIPEPKYSVGERVMVRSIFRRYNRDDVQVIQRAYLNGVSAFPYAGWYYTVDTDYSDYWCYEQALRPRPIPAGDFREMMESLVNPVMPKLTKPTPA